MSDNLRGWFLLILGFIGAYISIVTFRNSLKQRRIENTFKTIDFLRKHITTDQINTFITLFHANNELKGKEYNQFTFENGREDFIETMFSEGGCGNGDIHNMIELFNMICPTFENLEVKLIWYEYGQIMIGIYKWTKYIEENVNTFPNKHFFSNFNNFMKSKMTNYLDYPMKYYVYIE
ncbi:MAG: hypothetical protein RL308_867 [Bacteroidota bacterium]|jgi:hypothetical protein